MTKTQRSEEQLIRLWPLMKEPVNGTFCEAVNMIETF